MKNLRTINCVVLAATFSLAIADSAQAIKILFHGRAIDAYDPADLFVAQVGEDRYVLTYLRQQYGYNNVDYLRGEFANPDGSTAAGYDVIYLSSSMNTAIIRGKYEDSTVGVVNSESNTDSDNTLGNFMLSDDSGDYGYNPVTGPFPDPLTYPIRHKLNILDPSHPLAGGLSGIVQVFTDPPQLNTGLQYGLGALGGGVSLVAGMVKDDGTVPESPPGTPRPEHVLYAADVGGALRGTGAAESPAIAAGRRVHWFNSDYGFTNLTTDGLTLFNAAINWGASNASPPLPGDYNQDDEVNAADYVAYRKSPTFGVDGPTTSSDPTYNQWVKNYGLGTAGAASSPSQTYVPEPASIGLLLVCLGILAGRRHR